MKSSYETEFGSIEIKLNQEVFDDIMQKQIRNDQVMITYRDFLLDNMKFEIERMFENYFLEREEKAA
jgi:hypothetical protein